MPPPIYRDGQEIKDGDRIRYYGDPGEVEFIVAHPTGDPSHDWYLEQFPGGGVMLNTESMGSVFVKRDDLDDSLELISRRPDVPAP